MGRGGWWATVYGVTKSRARLKRLNTHTQCLAERVVCDQWLAGGQITEKSLEINLGPSSPSLIPPPSVHHDVLSSRLGRVGPSFLNPWGLVLGVAMRPKGTAALCGLSYV